MNQNTGHAPRPVAPLAATRVAPERHPPLVVSNGRLVRIFVRVSDAFIDDFAKRFGIQDRTDASFAPAKSKLEAVKEAGHTPTHDGSREHAGTRVIDKGSIAMGVFMATLAQTRVLIDAAWYLAPKRSGGVGKVLRLDFVADSDPAASKRVATTEAISATFAGLIADNVEVWTNPTVEDIVGDITVNFMRVTLGAKKARTRLVFTERHALVAAEADGPYDVFTGKTYVAPAKAPVAG